MLYVRCKQPELDRKGLDGFNKDSHGEEGSLESVGSPESQDSMFLPIHGPVTVDLSLNHDIGGMLEVRAGSSQSVGEFIVPMSAPPSTVGVFTYGN